MKHIRQPEGSNLCGQACVAMIAGISLESSISVFGKRSSTSTKDVIAALRQIGVRCVDKLLRVKANVKTPLCLVVMHFADESHTHWSVWNKGIYYDPAMGVGNKLPEGVWETSFLPIWTDEDEEE